jgi:hypothetical protein
MFEMNLYWNTSVFGESESEIEWRMVFEIVRGSWIRSAISKGGVNNDDDDDDDDKEEEDEEEEVEVEVEDDDCGFKNQSSKACPLQVKPPTPPAPNTLACDLA